MKKHLKPSGYRTSLETSAPGYLAKRFKQLRKQTQPVEAKVILSKVIPITRR